ncbi:hypothetical protein GRAQ_01784 [Rahnella aquatilis CIP 78.65 = ATCC 33071]|uniref:RHS repeat-associated core domain protein n=1 Tax=Rahnella aquatilis (strain ATCC 33071 / DSM 4594 / JCM 1683 / NBRC 105701 / NCIMB 13365 / CIP 78.65) TaxID=745277 RepID=H2IRT0_RAHAC|nr:RHS repeat-associated core domain-containing protein [Rahnella aquatilis]AEX52581.1 RHS repeat-associated core domain protein [Rahnella aquatilis CIP 78.65 = ATCC 33071]KFD06115.1 hypothetical protein GRAQ_01784 [Rahnella aquatilis CIP 78.65 = ATCC 33071]
MKQQTNLYTQTPDIGVYDNRGLLIRGLRYNRASLDDALQELISQNSYTDQGFIKQSTDARLFARMQHGESVVPNITTIYSLSGQPLKTESVDAGSSWQMGTCEGHFCWGQDSEGNQCWHQYDNIGRPVMVTEQAMDQASCVSERFIYGSDKSLNQNSRLIAHYDPAGVEKNLAYMLTGQPAGISRQLLADMDTPANWAGEDESAWQVALNPESFQTNWDYDATGNTTLQTDARGNQQRWVCNVAGQLQEHYLTLAGDTEKVTVSDIEYSAAGQILRETAGNGVVTQYIYEAETQRITGVTTLRGDNTTLCDLRYEYDPVGNVTFVTDLSQDVRFYKNRRVTPDKTYSYDALYQLISASGRQNNTIVHQGPELPAPIVDSSNLVPWNRSYTYDAAGNMTQFSHLSEQNFTQQTVIATNNNRALLQTGDVKPEDVDDSFDATGNILMLQPGQPMIWDQRNELQQITLVQRSNENDSDWERYYYAGGHQRIAKKAQLNSGQNTQQVLYLPGMEIRCTRAGENVSEQIVTVNISAGSAQLRVLVWETGGDTSITSPQWRYSLGNLIRSQNIELDEAGNVLTIEEYFPFGGTAVWAGNSSEVKYKYVRYSGKELDRSGLYYYGLRYYMPWCCRWVSADPGGIADGLNLYCMVHNNPVSYHDIGGMISDEAKNEIKGYGCKPSQGKNSHFIVKDIAEGLIHVSIKGTNEQLSPLGFKFSRETSEPRTIEYLAISSKYYRSSVVGGSTVINPVTSAGKDLQALGKVNALNKMTVVINGGFYNMGQKAAGNEPENTPIGPTVYNGNTQVKSLPVPSQYANDYHSLSLGYQSKLSSAPLLSSGGQPRFESLPANDANYKLKNPRQIPEPGTLTHAAHPNPRAAIISTRKIVDEGMQRLLIGKSTGERGALSSNGYTLSEWSMVVNRINQLNPIPGTALNLDGGGSAYIGVIGSNGEKILESSQLEGGRAAANFIRFSHYPPQAGQSTSTRL